MYENYISWIQILLDELVLNGTTKMKLAMLALLYRQVFAKNSIVNLHAVKSVSYVNRGISFINMDILRISGCIKSLLFVFF